MKRIHIWLFIFAFALLTAKFSTAQSAAPLAALAKMPVKEVTIFKDGHAFVLHEGAMPVDATGSVLMDYLPAPVLGTFWAYSADKNLKLNSVTAGQRRVLVERTALRLYEMLEANAGAEVIITERDLMGQVRTYSATIIGIPRRTAQELEATSPPNTGDKLPQKGEVIMLKTSEGTKVIALDRIQDVTFKNQLKSSIGEEEFRNLLTLKLDWAGRAPAKTADVGLVYLQKGIRWIPSYRIALDGQGNAIVKLQATLINELTDLDDVTANLVIGVPSFTFKDTLDPMALQREAAQLSGYFQQASDRTQMLSNAMMTQTARMSERVDRVAPPPAPAAADLGPEVTDATRNEDLFLFTVKRLSLKKGQRMTLPVTEFTVKYKDIYALELAFAPPAEVRMSLNNEQQADVARLLNAPKATHKIRLTNSSQMPLTTAPVLLVKDDRVLAQAMMTYTASGASVDIELTKAVDIQVAKSETETGRTPNAVRWNGDWFIRVELNGSLKLTNYRKETSEIEITRFVLGNVTSADNRGVIQKINVLENDQYVPMGEYPSWWRWYSWPHWWNQLNGIGRITWKVNLEPNKSIELNYRWNYYWR
ncbi:MAG: hypothetical protein AB1757_02720 [Acidobacteriota bacterium]